jgi:hypothetical protein
VLRSCEQTTTHARGSDCSQSRNGGRFQRFGVVCIEMGRLPGERKISPPRQDLQVCSIKVVHRVDLVWMFSCDE